MVLAAHSCSGVRGCQIVSGLENSKRVSEGNDGGVFQALFMAAMLVAEGNALVDALGRGLPHWTDLGCSLAVSTLTGTSDSIRAWSCVPWPPPPSSKTIFQPKKPITGRLSCSRTSLFHFLRQWSAPAVALVFPSRISSILKTQLSEYWKGWYC